MKQVYWFLARNFLLCLVVYALFGILCTLLTTSSTISTCGFLLSYCGLTILLSQRINTGLCKTLRQAAILDTPNERSMHTIPVPRGGGWSFVIPLGIALGFAILGAALFSDRYDELDTPHDRLNLEFLLPLMLLGGVVSFTIISWLDDQRGVGARWRLLTQLAVTSLTLIAYQVAATGTLAFPVWPELLSITPAAIPSWLPMVAILTVLVILWTGFMNFYNFMDGIDGITAIETISLSGGILALSYLSLLMPGTRVFFTASYEIFTTTLILLTLLGCSIGFLRTNWFPAKLFLGDVGSITIGYLLGFCLLALIPAGYWNIALTLPLYYLADGGITLLRRLLRGEKVWQAHRSHFYQRATQAVGRHDIIVIKIALCNLALIIIAALQIRYSPWFLAAAPLPVALLLHNMANQRHSALPKSVGLTPS